MVVIMSSLWYKMSSYIESSDDEQVGENINPITGSLVKGKLKSKRCENIHHPKSASVSPVRQAEMDEYVNSTPTKKFPKNRFIKTELKDNLITNSKNDMTVNTSGLFGDIKIPMRVDYNNSHKKFPKFPHNNKYTAERVLGKKFISSYPPCPTWKTKITSTLYSDEIYNSINDWYKGMPDEQKKKLNTFQVDLNKHKYGVIDADSKEASDYIKSVYPNLPFTKSSGNINKIPGKEGCTHHFFKKHPEDVDVYSTELAKAHQGWKEGDDPKFNFDVLVDSLLFENTKGNLIGYDGKDIPTIRMKDIEKNHIKPYIIKSDRNKDNKSKFSDEKKQLERDLNDSAVAHKQSEFDTILDVDLVQKLFNIVPIDSLLPRANWLKYMCVLKSQITDVNNKIYLEMFQKKMEEVHKKFRDSDGKVDGETWTIWKNENKKEWIKPQKNYFHVGILWKCAYETDRKTWSELKNTIGGIPNPVVMSDIKYYDEQKLYFEKSSKLIMRGKQPTICIFDTHTNEYFGGGLTKPEFKQTEWNAVKTYVKKKLDTLDSNGQPEYSDKLIGTFADIWLGDTRKRCFIDQDFLPDGWEYSDIDDAERIFNDKTILNTWNGMYVKRLENPSFLNEIDKLKSNNLEEYGDEYHSIADILELIYLLSGKDEKVYQYVMNFIAITLVYPAIRPGVFLVFKSIPGVGKNLLWDWIGKLLGSEYYMCSASKNAWFDKHSVDKEGKLLMNLNEMEYKVMQDNLSAIKEMITDPIGFVNPKNEKMRRIRNLGSYVGLTNKNFSIPINHANRRICLIECFDGHKSIPNYFSNIVGKMGDKKNQYLFFQYCRDVIKPEPSYNFERNMPKTEYHAATAERSMANKYKFVKWFAGQYHKEDDDEVIDLCGNGWIDQGKFYSIYKRWCSVNKEGGGDGCYKSFTSFELDFNAHTLDVKGKTKAEQKTMLDLPEYGSKFIINSRTSRNGKKCSIFKFDFSRYYEHFARYGVSEFGKDYTIALNEIMNYKREEDIDFIGDEVLSF